MQVNKDICNNRLRYKSKLYQINYTLIYIFKALIYYGLNFFCSLIPFLFERYYVTNLKYLSIIESKNNIEIYYI